MTSYSAVCVKPLYKKTDSQVSYSWGIYSYSTNKTDTFNHIKPKWKSEENKYADK